MEKEKLLKNHKIIISIIILFFIILLLTLLFNKGYSVKDYIISNTAWTIIQNSSLPSIRPNYMEDMRNSSAKNLSNARDIIDKNKEHIRNTTAQINLNGYAEILVPNITMVCEKENRKISPKQFFEDEHCNYSISGGSSKSEGTPKINIKIQSNKTHKVILELFGKSLSNFLSEYVYYSLEDIDNKIDQNGVIMVTEISGDVMTLLESIAKVTILWASLIPEISKNYEQQNKTLKGAIIEFSLIDQNMSLPTEDQINSIKIKENCIKNLESVSKNSASAQISKALYLDSLLFRKRKIEEMCEEMDKSQKKILINILKDVNKEENPFIGIIEKLFLKMNAECNYNLNDIENSKNCMNGLLIPFNSSINPQE